MEARPVRSGSVIARRYRAVRKIASGAMGEVWEAVHVELAHRVAVKVLRADALESREILVRFAREAFLLAHVQSEHVVRVIDFAPRGRHGPALVMELVEGPTFADRLHEGGVSLAESVDVAIDVLHGLRAMHEARVIHRDVKPGNVILRKLHDGRTRAVLIDLGVGRMLEPVCDDGDVAMDERAEVTSADRVVGTIEYMAPEQIVSCQTAGPLVDVYAVGAMLWRAVAGEHPFGDKHGADLIQEKVRTPVPRLRSGRRDSIGRRLENVVERAVAFSMRDRYQSADAMLDALESLRSAMRDEAIGLEESAEDIVTVRAPRVRSRRRKALIAIAAVCATALAALSTELIRHTPPAVHEVGVTTQ